jgi:uncharacterized OB-fold protein
MNELNAMTPVRPGLLQTDPPRLLGSQCETCGTRVFPARDFCPRCDSEAAPAPVELSPTGTVFSYTVVRQSPGARPVPYVLAYVDLDDQVRVLAQLDDEPLAAHIGQRVHLVLRNVAPPTEDARLGYAFAPLSSCPKLEEPTP